MNQMKPEHIHKFFKCFKYSDNCWEWKLSTSLSGYGEFHINGTSYRAHRISYELFKGKIPEGLVIDHLCRNRACVNPKHLEAVTLTENTMRGKGVTVLASLKTHCDYGHPFDGENLKLRNRPNGRVWRICKICHADLQSKYRKRKKSKLKTFITNIT